MKIRIKKVSLIIISYLSVCMQINAASLWDSFWEGVGYTKVSTPSKPIVDLPKLPPLVRYATQQEQTTANEHRFLALGYKHESDRKQCTKKEQQALLRFHAAAQYGEPTSCKLLADFYRTGRYGLGPDEEVPKIYEANMKWWEPERLFPQALPAAEDDATDETIPVDIDEAPRRSSDDSDHSSISISTTGGPVSELRHRKVTTTDDS